MDAGVRTTARTSRVLTASNGGMISRWSHRCATDRVTHRNKLCSDWRRVMETSAVASIAFETHPSAYRHWRLSFNGAVATLGMDVREDAGLRDDYRLKLNSYELGVDIELADAVQ